MANVIKDTQDIRSRLLLLWKQIEEKKISSSEARLHISVARAILETLKVDMAAAHLSQTNIPAVPLTGGGVMLAPRGDHRREQ
jgi:hypothetical protein